MARLLRGLPRLGHACFAQEQKTRLDMRWFWFAAILPVHRSGIFAAPGLLMFGMQGATNHRSALDSAAKVVCNIGASWRGAREPDR